MDAAEIDRHGRLAWARGQLARYRFWDWTLRLDTDHWPQEAAVLDIHYTAENSRQPGQRHGFRARREVRIHPGTFHADVHAALQDAWMHEFWEGLRLDGELVRDPHADPDRWHCPCGGVGPVKQAGSWRCPGCGTNHTRDLEMGDSTP